MMRSPRAVRPTRPTARSIIYNARVSGNQKLFRLDLATGKMTQITFGTHDDTAAQFVDPHTIVFSSTATDPRCPSNRRSRATATSTTCGR